MANTSLKAEVKRIIQRLDIERARDLHPDLITNEVMDAHPDIHGKDANFHLRTSRAEVRGVVRDCLNQYRLSADLEVDQHVLFEGYTRVQKRYLIKIAGVQVARDVLQLTQSQFAEKKRELRAMGEGCFLHERELDRLEGELDNLRAARLPVASEARAE